jgi:DNA-binding IclR family transcriptional regulator
VVDLAYVRLLRVVETLLLVAEGRNRVMLVAEWFDVSRPTAHSYLQQLRNAGLVEKAPKRGKAQPYRLTEAGVSLLWSVLHDLDDLKARIREVMT